MNKKAAEAAREKGEPEPLPECRFLFPRPLREDAEMIKRSGKTWWTFEAARNDSQMNQFSRLASLCWLANTDFSPCTGIEAVINYAAKYCSKSESQTSTYAEISKAILPHVSDRNPMLSFVSKMMNRLIGERDYSAQEVCHLLLGLPLQEDSRIVRSVDCRLPERHNHTLEFSENDEVVEQKKTAYEKYPERSEDLEGVSYFEFLERWNFAAPNPGTWRKWQHPAKPRVLYYFPRYKPIPTHRQFEDFCRVKLMLNHPHRAYDELLTVDDIRFDTHKTAYLHCQQHHEHENDHYGDVENLDPDADPEEWEPRMGDDDITLEDWQELARLVPDLEPEQEAANVLGRRDIDINHDWLPHVDRYRHDDFSDGKYWTNRQGETVITNDVEYIPPDVRNTLNPEQRLVYDTHMGHFQQRDAPPIRLQVDGGGGTGKSYMVKVLSSHLQQASLSEKSPVVRAAPTGVASNQINGQTLHSLLRLPIDGKYRPLAETPTVLSNLQRVFSGVKYLIIDEKVCLALKP